LNRTNRIAALIIGSVAAAIVAVLLFGAGMFVGAEDSGGAGRHGSGSSEYDGGGHDEDHGDDHQSDDQDHAEGDDDNVSDHNDDSRGCPDEQRRSEAPESSMPATTRP